MPSSSSSPASCASSSSSSYQCLRAVDTRVICELAPPSEPECQRLHSRLVCLIKSKTGLSIRKALRHFNREIPSPLLRQLFLDWFSLLSLFITLYNYVCFHQCSHRLVGAFSCYSECYVNIIKTCIVAYLVLLLCRDLPSVSAFHSCHPSVALFYTIVLTSA